MPKRKKAVKHTERTQNNLDIENLKKKLAILEAQGKEEYKPKIGRRISALKRKIK